MNTTASVDVLLRVTSVRSRGPLGGAIFAGKDVAGAPFVVKASYQHIPDPTWIEVAQVWRVVGSTAVVDYEHQGVRKSEVQITAEKVELQRPSGKHLVGWIARSPECHGIGEVRARRLYEAFGQQLADLIEHGDADQLSQVVTREAAEALIAAFAKHRVAQTLTWLDQLGISRSLGASIAGYWGADARSKVEENPYVLVSFCGTWSVVDRLAQDRFGIPAGDRRRLVAAVEEVLYRGMDDGHTAMTSSDVLTRLQKLLGDVGAATEAIDAAVEEHRANRSGDLLQPAGLSIVEACIAAGLRSILTGVSEDQGELFEATLPQEQFVRRHVAAYELAQGIELTDEQRSAVLVSATNRFSLILGGAGTGKTTVLKTLCHVIEEATPGAEIHLLALAGRAAQRMGEATGRPAATIASFLRSDVVAPGATVVVDEVSMVDALLMYRLLRHLPAGVRLILVGDPAQLPPIGPGLVLHALEGLAFIPQTTLKTVKRQDAASGIPQVAQAVREHRLPTWAPHQGVGVGVSTIHCSDAELDETVARVYEELGGDGASFDVQILSVTRGSAGGVRQLNALIHERFARLSYPVLNRVGPHGATQARTEDGLGLFVGDLVIYGSNDYALGLRNGSLGVITAAKECRDDGSAVCHAEFEGTTYALTEAHLQHVKHAYAITTHKSQGSQFKRVVLAVRKSMLLDNSLIYTAITRGVSQVVIVGDVAALERAIRERSHSSRRRTRLQELLAKQLDGHALSEADEIAFCP